MKVPPIEATSFFLEPPRETECRQKHQAQGPKETVADSASDVAGSIVTLSAERTSVIYTSDGTLVRY
ncbi:hypothetical protein YOLOSWAG_281 [Erwinia phage vB_EamM_Yoloswag]|uniref:Uncharacterized protein n=1 Tax=Erwinia phage vB_EamM_Yoloswag TaxID=1958956 RepID=A0A1S6L3R5_9CAUD|nr:hypothetical protein HOR66_gp281 [Erwinia phage vB_EamM_Yoloswag]AQT28820.1 hypothetical protein YOLOSWAG_281 [Erwinia phage vB_EamM_Yoloswag]